MAIVYAEDGSRVKASDMLWNLQYMAHTNKPLFVGRLENDWWKEDKTLTAGMKKGYIEIIPNEGFIITEKGIDLLKRKGLHTSRHPLGDLYDKLDPKAKEDN